MSTKRPPKLVHFSSVGESDYRAIACIRWESDVSNANFMIPTREATLVTTWLNHATRIDTRPVTHIYCRDSGGMEFHAGALIPPKYDAAPTLEGWHAASVRVVFSTIASGGSIWKIPDIV